MHVVMTTVEVEPGSIDELAALFDETNRSLVAGHDDWLAAYFTADRSSDTVTVIAHWASAASYEALRESEEYRSTISRFATRFTGPPRVAIHEVLVEM